MSSAARLRMLASGLRLRRVGVEARVVGEGEDLARASGPAPPPCPPPPLASSTARDSAFSVTYWRCRSRVRVTEAPWRSMGSAVPPWDEQLAALGVAQAGQARVLPAQLVVEGQLQALQPVAVEAHHAHHVRAQLALRVEALGLLGEADARQPERLHRLHLARASPGASPRRSASRAREPRRAASSGSSFSALASARAACFTSGSMEGSTQTESTSTLCASGAPRRSKMSPRRAGISICRTYWSCASPRSLLALEHLQHHRAPKRHGQQQGQEERRPAAAPAAAASAPLGGSGARAVLKSLTEEPSARPGALRHRTPRASRASTRAVRLLPGRLRRQGDARRPAGSAMPSFSRASFSSRAGVLSVASSSFSRSFSRCRARLSASALGEPVARVHHQHAAGHVDDAHRRERGRRGPRRAAGAAARRPRTRSTCPRAEALPCERSPA